MKLHKIPSKICIGLIRVYQVTFSPDHSWLKGMFPHGYCKFRPTCSDYTADAIKKYGVLRGLPKGIYRILRCNPWNKGGNDPVK